MLGARRAADAASTVDVRDRHVVRVLLVRPVDDPAAVRGHVGARVPAGHLPTALPDARRENAPPGASLPLVTLTSANWSTWRETT